MEGQIPSHFDRRPTEVTKTAQRSFQQPCEDFEYHEQPPAPSHRHQPAPTSPHLPSKPSLQPTSERMTSFETDRKMGPTAHSSPPSLGSNPLPSDTGSPGLQSLSEREDEKVGEQKVFPAGDAAPHKHGSSRGRRQSRLCGLPKKRFLVLAGLLLCTVFVLSLVLGIVLGMQKM